MSARLAVHVQPGARSPGFAGRADDGALRLRVKEPAREGRANEAVEMWVAELLGMPRSAVRVVRGAGSRRKLIEVEGLEAETLRVRLEKALSAVNEEDA